jgi:hypothetical protein
MLIGVEGTASSRAKSSVVWAGKLAGIAVEYLTALKTRSLDFLDRARWVGSFRNHTFLATEPTASIFVPADKNRHWFATMPASCFDAWRSFRAFEPFVETVRRAKAWRVVLHDRWWALKGFPAYFAGERKWHNKIPPVRDARILDNGAGLVREPSFSERFAKPFLSLVNYNISGRKVQVGGTYGT